VDLNENEYIIAYNLDVVEGSPHEWIGVYEAKPETSQFSINTSDGNEKAGSPDEVIQSIHKKADKLARSNVAKPKVAGGTGYQWKTDWDQLQRNEWHKEHWSGAEIGWDVQWKKHPDDNSKQGLFAELKMNYVNNKLGHIDFHFNTSNCDVASYRPGNTVGTSSDSWSLGIGSDSVGISLTQTQTTSNIDVDMVGDTIGPDDGDVEHEYTISGDLRENEVVLNSAAVAEVDEESGETFANIDLKGEFGYYNLYALSNGYKYYWA